MTSGVERGEGVTKSRQKEQNQLISVFTKGGVGSKILWTSYVNEPASPPHRHTLVVALSFIRYGGDLETRRHSRLEVSVVVVSWSPLRIQILLAPSDIATYSHFFVTMYPGSCVLVVPILFSVGYPSFRLMGV